MKAVTRPFHNVMWFAVNWSSGRYPDRMPELRVLSEWFDFNFPIGDFNAWFPIGICQFWYVIVS